MTKKTDDSPRTPKRKPDPEFVALARIDRQLTELEAHDEQAPCRVLRMLADRWQRRLCDRALPPEVVP